MEGDPILEQVAEKCGSDTFMREGIGNRLLSILKRIPGAQGIAAPQLGVSSCVVCIRWKKDYTVLYNPVVKAHGILWKSSTESCLSCYHIYTVKRPMWLIVQYEDIAGEIHREFCWCRKACIIMHEVDHLNGKCINRGKERGCYVNAGHVPGLT